jgi:hypothetical protein
MNRSCWISFVAAATLALSTLLAQPNAALAGSPTANCNGVYSAGFATTWDSLAYKGYYSHLDPQTLAICTSPVPGGPSASWGWSAVGATSASCNDPILGCPLSIVQIGRGACRYSVYESCQGTGQRLFAAYGRSEASDGCEGLDDILPVPLNRAPAPTDTGLHYYRVWLDGSTWRFDHWPKGQAVTQVFVVAASLICWTSRAGLSFNETWERGDAVGGSATNHYNFQSMTRLTAGVYGSQHSINNAKSP